MTRSRAALLGALALVLLGGLPASAAATVCDRFGAVAVAGTVQDDTLVEASGIAASRAWPGVLWSHNDSGGKPEIVALSSTGAALGRYPLTGAKAVDWEDIAVGPGPQAGRSYVYVADIGDNGGRRSDVTVYRVAEPSSRPTGTNGALGGVERFHLRYPFPPTDGALYVLTKNHDGPRNSVLRAPASALRDGAAVAMTEVATFDAVTPTRSAFDLLGLFVTGADISPSGDLILVRTYSAVLAFARRPGTTVAAALAAPPCFAPQGEAVGFAADGRAYFTLSEGAHPALHRVPFRPTAAPRPAPPAPSTDHRWVLIGAAGAAALVVIIGAVLLQNRSRPGHFDPAQ